MKLKQIWAVITQTLTEFKADIWVLSFSDVFYQIGSKSKQVTHLKKTDFWPQ